MGQFLVGTEEGLIGPGENVRLSGRVITWIEPNRDGWWVLTDSASLVDVRPDGDPIDVASVPGAAGNCVLATSDRVMVGAADATLFDLDGERLVRRKDFDEAPGRDSWYTPWGGPPDVRSMAVDVDGTVYLNVHVGGVLVQPAGSEAWTATMDINADVHQVIAHPDSPGVALAASAVGLGVTTDGGESWEFRSDGLLARYCRAAAVSDDTVYVSASQGPRGGKAAIYRGQLEGGPFTRLGNGLPEWFATNVNTGCLAARGDVIACASPGDGAVWISEDKGEAFELAIEGLNTPTRIALTD